MSPFKDNNNRELAASPERKSVAKSESKGDGGIGHGKDPLEGGRYDLRELRTYHQ
jgi:hypothetical protein